MNNNEMTTALRTGLLIFAILYLISPIDLMPGLPFDDILIFVLQAVIRRKLADNDNLVT